MSPRVGIKQLIQGTHIYCLMIRLFKLYEEPNRDHVFAGLLKSMIRSFVIPLGYHYRNAEVIQVH